MANPRNAPKPVAKQEEAVITPPAVSTVTEPLVGGDPLPSQPAPVEAIDPEAVEALALALARSQGLRRPSPIQLRTAVAISFHTLAEMILIGQSFAANTDA